jgi:hypothetical protein
MRTVKIRRALGLLALAFLLGGCASTRQQPYWLANTDLKCDGVIVMGAMPLIDPVQAYSVCEDRQGRLYFPNGVLANTTITGASGLLSAAVTQAGQIGAMLGGF